MVSLPKRRNTNPGSPSKLKWVQQCMLIAAALSGCGAAGSDNFSKHTCVKCVTKCVHEQGWNPRNFQCSCPKPRLHFLFHAVGFWSVLNTKTLYSSISFLLFLIFMLKKKKILLLILKCWKRTAQVREEFHSSQQRLAVNQRAHTSTLLQYLHKATSICLMKDIKRFAQRIESYRDEDDLLRNSSHPLTPTWFN